MRGGGVISGFDSSGIVHSSETREADCSLESTCTLVQLR